jgi:hypothetical protein
LQFFDEQRGVIRRIFDEQNIEWSFHFSRCL